MESTARPKPDRRKNPRARETKPITGGISRGVPEAEIARRAFELYCARGGQHGSDVEDWLRAERELIAGAASHPAPVLEMVNASDTGARREPRAPRRRATVNRIP